MRVASLSLRGESFTLLPEQALTNPVISRFSRFPQTFQSYGPTKVSIGEMRK